MAQDPPHPAAVRGAAAARGAAASRGAAAPRGAAAERVAVAVREVLAAIPGGCTWLLPIEEDGAVVDFRVAAASEEGHDIYGRGASRVDARLSELYPSMVGGTLWRTYQEVLASGVPGRVADFRYREKRAGVVADSLFEVSVYPVLGGLLAWWERLDENLRRIDRTEQLGSLGWAEYDLVTGRSEWSPGMYRIFDRDPARGPLPRAEQSALVEPEDRGLVEAAWQTMDSGSTSDITVRFRSGDGTRYLRILSDVARDADGTPLKISAVVQDVTARETSRTAIERLSDQLRSRELTALAEHRLAAQLQNLIQPVPEDVVALAGLEAIVGYLPAESAVNVGGDWYHAQTLPDGLVVLAVGDVAGHGLDAASGMAHLRFALIAWLSIGLRDPGALLAHMNGLCWQLRITGTAVVALYDPATKLLSWARAGHAPPLLARAGTAAPLELPRGMLLGADVHESFPVVTSRLRADDLVLLYTDGLVERRHDRGGLRRAEVHAALAGLSTTPGTAALPRLRGLLYQASPDDDTCTLAVRVLP